MGKSSPQPTPPRDIAEASTSTNIASAIANNTMRMVDQTTPFGTTTSRQTGSETFTDPYTGIEYQIPTYATETSLTPGLQRAFDANTGATTNAALASQNAARQLKNRDPFRARGLPALQDDIPGAGRIDGSIAGAGDIQRSYQGADDFSGDRMRVEDALMGRMDTYLDRDRDRLETRLANQGIDVGSQAYRDAHFDLNRSANDARMAAILSAGDEQARLVGMSRDAAGFGNAAQAQQFGQNLTGTQLANAAQAQRFGQNQAGAQFANQARSQDLAERIGIRNQPLNEFLALRSGSQVQTPPMAMMQPQGFNPAPVGNIIASGDAARQDAFTQRQAATGSTLSSLGNLALGLASLSDERVKDDKKKVAETEDGLGIYQFRYKGSPTVQLGLMAQDVKKKKPKAVQTGPMGLMSVDYGKALS